MSEHWFWGAVTMAVIAWYSTITLYISVKGTFEIRQMLRRLKRDGKKER